MNHSNRAAGAAGTKRKASPIHVMHQQAQQTMAGGTISIRGGEPALTPQRDESEVSREVSHLTHSVDELHIALERLEERLSPVLAAQVPQMAGADVAPAAESPLGGVLQGQANSVDLAIRRVHVLMNAIRI